MVATKVKKKDPIFDQGQSADMIYLVISGTVRLSMVNKENKRVVVTLVPPGDLFAPPVVLHAYAEVDSNSKRFAARIRRPTQCRLLVKKVCAFGLKPIGAVRPATK